MPEISFASPDDADAIASLGGHAFGEYTFRSGQSVLHMLQRRGAQCLVAKRRGRVIGFSILRLGDRDTAWLDAIAVSEAERGQGFGKALLEQSERAAARLGASVMALATADANLAALDLFLRSGYRIVERLPRYYQRGQDAVGMLKRL